MMSSGGSVHIPVCGFFSPAGSRDVSQDHAEPRTRPLHLQELLERAGISSSFLRPLLRRSLLYAPRHQNGTGDVPLPGRIHAQETRHVHPYVCVPP